MDPQDPRATLVRTALQEGLSQRDVRRFVHVSNGFVSEIAKELRNPSPELEVKTLNRIESYIPRSLDYWALSMEQGVLRPESIPASVGILLDHRQRLLDRMSTGTPESPAYSPQRLLEDLTSMDIPKDTPK
jgi:transcriptional regulator with XRE-family HTH domain